MVTGKILLDDALPMIILIECRRGRQESSEKELGETDLVENVNTPIGFRVYHFKLEILLSNFTET